MVEIEIETVVGIETMAEIMAVVVAVGEGVEMVVVMAVTHTLIVVVTETVTSPLAVLALTTHHIIPPYTIRTV